MFKAKRTILAGLFLSLLLNSSTGIAAPACTNLFLKPGSPLWRLQIRLVANHLAHIWKSHRDKMITYETFKAEEKKLNATFKRLLEEAGLKVRYEVYDTDWSGFVILPEGTHPLVRVARSLNRKGITLAVSPSVWAKDALGSFDSSRKVINIDLESILTGRIGFTMSHELRHAHGELRSYMEDSAYERIFRTELNAENTPGRRLPGADESYKDYFVLDELLAHRQSATYLVRELKRNSSDEVAISYLKVHGERLKNFVETGLATFEVLKRKVEASAYSVFWVPDRPMASLYVKLNKSGILTRWFQSDAKDEDLVGLKAKFVIPMAELREIDDAKGVRSLLLSKIDATIAEIETLRLPVENVSETIESIKSSKKVTEKELREVEEALRSLSETISQRRRAMRDGHRTLH